MYTINMVQERYEQTGQKLRKPVFSDELSMSGRQDSNLRPPRPERGALPGCATPRIFLLFLNFKRPLLAPNVSNLRIQKPDSNSVHWQKKLLIFRNKYSKRCSYSWKRFHINVSVKPIYLRFHQVKPKSFPLHMSMQPLVQVKNFTHPFPRQIDS
jgi:hypothetical protein